MATAATTMPAVNATHSTVTRPSSTLMKRPKFLLRAFMVDTFPYPLAQAESAPAKDCCDNGSRVKTQSSNAIAKYPPPGPQHRTHITRWSTAQKLGRLKSRDPILFN